MKETLFEIPESLHPFLAWKRKHGITTHEDEPYKIDGMKEYPRWCASPPHELWPEASPGDCGYGYSEEEACYEVCVKHHLEWFQKIGART